MLLKMSDCDMVGLSAGTVGQRPCRSGWCRLWSHRDQHAREARP